MERTRSLTNLISLFSVLVIFYFMFYFLFFFVLGNNSVEFVIAFGFISLVFLVYKKVKNYLYFYLWNLSKDIWLHYVTLLYILKATRKMILTLNRTYLVFLKNKLILLNSISYSLDDIWGNLNTVLLNKYLINNVLRQLIYKYNLIYLNTNKVNNYIYMEFNSLYRIKMVNTLTLLVFLKNYK